MSPNKPEERRREVEARLKGALRELLPSRTFQEMRVEDIAESAGLSRSSFYFYYPDKRALLMEATAEIADRLFEQADRWWHGEGEPVELVSEAIAGVAGTWAESGDLIACTAEVATYDERMYSFFSGLVERFIEATAQHITREQEAGRTDPSLDARSTATTLVWGLERCLYVAGRAGESTRAKLVEAIIETWIRTLYGRAPERGVS